MYQTEGLLGGIINVNSINDAPRVRRIKLLTVPGLYL